MSIRALLLGLYAFTLSVEAVKPLHSHNDYEHTQPLIEALNVGITGVEADVWLQADGTLLVGHTEDELDPAKTLAALYLDPLLQIIAGEKESATVISVDNPVQLLIDFKNDGPLTFSAIIAALEPIRFAGYLTTYTAQDDVLSQGAVTVVGTGNTPLDSVVALNPRDLFFDADIHDLDSTMPGEGLSWGPNISPLASHDFYTSAFWLGILPITSIQRNRIAILISSAHAKGIKTRFWNTNSWPTFARNAIWKQLLDLETDWLNVDELEEASVYWAEYQTSDVDRRVVYQKDA